MNNELTSQAMIATQVALCINIRKLASLRHFGGELSKSLARRDIKDAIKALRFFRASSEVTGKKWL
jgi:hypothetical protein